MSNENEKQIKDRFYKQIKEERLKKEKIKSYRKDKDLIFVLKCRYCGKEHEIRQRYTNYYHCKCGRNLICYFVVNYLWSKVIYMSPLLKKMNVRSYDKWRDE